MAHKKGRDMPGLFRVPTAYQSGRRGLAGAWPFLQCTTDPADQQVDFGPGHGEGRREAQRVGAAVDHAEAVFAQPLLGRAGSVAFAVARPRAGETQAGSVELGYKT